MILKLYEISISTSNMLVIQEHTVREYRVFKKSKYRKKGFRYKIGTGITIPVSRLDKATTYGSMYTLDKSKIPSLVKEMINLRTERCNTWIDSYEKEKAELSKMLGSLDEKI